MNSFIDPKIIIFSEPFQELLATPEILSTIIKLSQSLQSNPSAQKLGLNCIIKISSTNAAFNSNFHLQLFIDLNILPTLNHCLKTDDTDLVYIALWLFHELASKGNPIPLISFYFILLFYFILFL